MTKSTRVSRHGSAGIKFKYPALYFAGTCGVGALQPTLEPQLYVSGVVVTDVAAARAVRSGTVDTGAAVGEALGAGAAEAFSAQIVVTLDVVTGVV